MRSNNPLLDLYAALMAFLLIGVIGAAKVAPGQTPELASESPPPQAAAEAGSDINDTAEDVKNTAIRAAGAIGDRSVLTSEEESTAESELQPQSEPQPLEQGPIHEAFAAPIGTAGAPEVSQETVAQQPPEPVTPSPAVAPP